MIDIETHQIIDMIDSREEDDVTKWLKSYSNLEVISRDGGIMYKSASDKSHPKAVQVSDRFHVLKNLTEYAIDALKRLLKKQINITEKNTTEIICKVQKKYEYKTKWDIILKVKELKKQKYRIIDIAQYLGISEKTVIEYNKISLDEKEKYEKIPIKVITMFPKVGKIYEIVKEFKELMFSKKHEKLKKWIQETKSHNIPEINSFLNGIERDFVAVKNGIKYDYNNGLAEGSVNKIKVIKRIMYGRCSFDLLKQKVLLQY